MNKIETEIVQTIWNDEEEHQAFLANPKQYLLEEGQEIPKDTEVNVYEDTPSLRHFLLPSETTQLPQTDELFHEIAKRAIEDSDFKAELLENPKTVAREMGIAIPDGLKIKVVEDKPSEINMIVPFNSASGELSDIDLEAVAGGKSDTNRKICGGTSAAAGIGCGIGAIFSFGATAAASAAGVATTTGASHLAG